MICQPNGVTRILGGLYSHFGMCGNLFPASSEELAAMDWRPQSHHQIGSGFILVLPGSGLLGMAQGQHESPCKNMWIYYSSEIQVEWLWWQCGPWKTFLLGQHIKENNHSGQAQKLQELVQMPRACRHFFYMIWFLIKFDHYPDWWIMIDAWLRSSVQAVSNQINSPCAAFCPAPRSAATSNLRPRR